MGHDRPTPAGQFGRWAATAFPHRTAALYRDQRINYHELDDQTNRLANVLLGLGLKTGDRVAVLLRNSIEAFVSGFAINRAGLAYVRLQPAESMSERLEVLDNSGARVVLMEAGFVDQWFSSSEGQVWPGTVIAVPASDAPNTLNYAELTSAASPDPPRVLVSSSDLAGIAYTSGTTGKPRGVVHTVGGQRNAIRNAFLNEDHAIDEDDVLLTVAPVTHAAGTFVQMFTLRGATNIILDHFDEEEVLGTIERERVSAVFMVPTMVYRLVNHPDVRRFDLTSLRMLYYAAAPMPVETLRKAMILLPECRFRQHYGLTEQPQPVTYLRPNDHAGVEQDDDKLARLDSVGRPVIGVEVRLVADDGLDAQVGEPGEVWIRSDYGMKEYWKNPEATADTIVDGWIRSGDVGRFDDGGYLYLVGRKKDMVISGGFNIYPREVERVIEELPGVAEVVVIGVPDDEWGESVKAFVQQGPGATLSEREIVEHCKDRLTRYKKPRLVEFVDDFPRNPAGKVLRWMLREAAWAGQERKI